jgi:nicotinate-nucleotide adenylyltransferase
MKIAVLGGSFNPVHLGHLALADEVCVSLGYEKILFVPAFSPPHKISRDFLPAEIRSRMIQLAVEDDGRFELEDCEIRRGGVSFTWDTINFLEEKYRNSLTEKIGLILGADLISTFHLWHNAENLAKKCTLILARRTEEKKSAEGDGGFFFNESTERYKNPQKKIDASSELFKDAVFLQNEILQISSTEIRRRLAKKMAVKYLVPEKVFKYIIGGNFYGTEH